MHSSSSHNIPHIYNLTRLPGPIGYICKYEHCSYVRSKIEHN